MKKNILVLTAATFIAGSLVFTSCKKDDVTAPVVTLTGSDMTINLQGTFTDPGATANDEKDGAITPVVSGNVDVNQTGVYEITYTATDAAGNAAAAKRLVTVVNELDNMNGTYVCTETPGTGSYTQTINASTTLNKRIIFGKFANYLNNTSIYADIVGTTVTLPSQLATNVGAPPNNADRTFSGTGLKSTTTFSISFTETTNGASTAYTVTLVKQ